MVVGVNTAAERLARQPRDNLVDVHVARRAGTGLEDIDREMRVVLTLRDGQRRLLDRFRNLAIEQLQLLVGARGGDLDAAQRADEAAAHAQAADREI